MVKKTVKRAGNKTAKILVNKATKKGRSKLSSSTSLSSTSSLRATQKLLQQARVGLLVIGDEILSGRTKDENINYIAKALTAHGACLTEVRVVGDGAAVIIAGLKKLLAENDFVLTTGGIGPTHDDITSAAVARALNLPLVIDPTADQLLRDHYAAVGVPYNDERRKMAMVPRGARLLPNSISLAPGFFVKRVFVMAGVPRIMAVMMDTVLTILPSGARWWQAVVETHLGEGTFARDLTALQARYPDVTIGSYPRFDHASQKVSASLVLRSLHQDRGMACHQELERLLLSLSKG